MQMSFGKYRDEDLIEIPREYLTWVLRNVDKKVSLDEFRSEILKAGA